MTTVDGFTGSIPSVTPPRPSWNDRPLSRRVKVTGLAQKLGQLEAVNMDLQS
jgi:hypothetical protein